jgi:hypothetical protein
MEPDISTLHKPDILILRRQTPPQSLTCYFSQLKMRADTQVAMIGRRLALIASLEKLAWKA